MYDDYKNFYNFLLDQSKLPSLKIRRMIENHGIRDFQNSKQIQP